MSRAQPWSGAALQCSHGERDAFVLYHCMCCTLSLYVVFLVRVRAGLQWCEYL